MTRLLAWLLLNPGTEEMAELNRYLVQKDREIIENYIERKNLTMTESADRIMVFD